MAIPIEWILNSTQSRIYAVSHSKAIIRDQELLEQSLQRIEQNITNLQSDVNTLNNELVNLTTRVKQLEDAIKTS